MNILNLNRALALKECYDDLEKVLSSISSEGSEKKITVIARVRPQNKRYHEDKRVEFEDESGIRLIKECLVNQLDSIRDIISSL